MDNTTGKTGKKRSLIHQYFTKDIYIELMKITMISGIDNNKKGLLIKDLLRNNNIPFSGLGPGTNRMAVMINGYAVKFALDKDGMIDNRREMLYTGELQPYVIKVYECTPNGLIAVCEFVEVFSIDDFHEYRSEMNEILEVITSNHLTGDVGITGKNYVNWGKRSDGSICILDFAYCYNVKYSVFVCSCNDDAILKFDDLYVNLVCPYCGRKYTFGDIRRRITKQQQEEEIGDIRRLGYNLTSSLEEVVLNPLFEPKKDTKKKKERTPVEQKIHDYLEKSKKNEDDEQDYWDSSLE